MKSLSDRFENLRKELEDDYDYFNNLADVKSALFIYKPENENIVIKEVERLNKKLEKKYETNLINCSKMLFESFGNILSIEELFQMEKQSRSTLLKEAHGPLLDNISNKIIQLNQKMERGILLLYRTGGLYPFIRIHAILAKIESKLENPTIFFYPGIYENKEFRFLYTDGTQGDYRVKIYKGE